MTPASTVRLTESLVSVKSLKIRTAETNTRCSSYRGFRLIEVFVKRKLTLKLFVSKIKHFLQIEQYWVLEKNLSIKKTIQLLRHLGMLKFF